MCEKNEFLSSDGFEVDDMNVCEDCFERAKDDE